MTEASNHVIASRDTSRSDGSNIYWQSNVCDHEITCQEACDAQANAGYRTWDYGIYDFSCSQVEGGYVAHWYCQNSCD
jgi:hypothetical protein